jgi:hypothetical protein
MVRPLTLFALSLSLSFLFFSYLIIGEHDFRKLDSLRPV